MTISEYQKYVEEGANPVYDQSLALLGLVGEVGELCEAGTVTAGPAADFLALEGQIGKLCDVIKKVHIYSDMSKFEAKYGMTAAEKVAELAGNIREQLAKIEAIAVKGDLATLGEVTSCSEEQKDEVLSECSDVLWQLALVYSKFDHTFDEVVDYNVAKLNKRHGGAGKTAADGGGVR